MVGVGVILETTSLGTGDCLVVLLALVGFLVVDLVAACLVVAFATVRLRTAFLAAGLTVDFLGAARTPARFFVTSEERDIT